MGKGSGQTPDPSLGGGGGYNGGGGDMARTLTRNNRVKYPGAVEPFFGLVGIRFHPFWEFLFLSLFWAYFLVEIVYTNQIFIASTAWTTDTQ